MTGQANFEQKFINSRMIDLERGDLRKIFDEVIQPEDFDLVIRNRNGVKIDGRKMPNTIPLKKTDMDGNLIADIDYNKTIKLNKKAEELFRKLPKDPEERMRLLKPFVEIALQEQMYNKAKSKALENYRLTAGELESQAVEARDAFAQRLIGQGKSKEDVIKELYKTHPMFKRSDYAFDKQRGLDVPEGVYPRKESDIVYFSEKFEETPIESATKQTDDILNNRHSDLTDEELITGYINTGFSGKSGVGRSELINRLKSKPELQQKSINKLQDLGVINEQTKTVPVYRLVITRGGKEIKPEKEISASLSIEAIQENLKFFEPKKGMLDEMYIVKYDVPKENVIGYLPAFKDDIKRGVNKKLKEKGFGQQKIRGYQTIGDPAKNAKNLLDKQDEIIVDVSNLEMQPMKSMMRETDDYTKGLPEASNLQKSIGTGRGFDEAILKIAKGEIKSLANLNQHMLDFRKETLISPIAKGADTKLEQQARQEFLDYYKNYFNKAEETAVKQTDNLPELRVDNPGKDFMGREYTDKKIESALEDKNKAIAAGLTETDTATVNIGNFSGQTAFFTKPVRLDPKMLKDVKGMMGEHKTRNKSRKLELLKKSIKEKGYEESPILIHVREDGVPFVTEGNHRLAEAIQSNRESIPVEIKYLRGAENVEGILNPKTLGLKNKMNRGGVPTMQKKNIESQQLELFGGLKDQGGTKDPVSGNDVPVGSTKKEVRDDIPAQLSEGEFVLPADVVRYHGLEKIMSLRDQAKQGLDKMEAMGQMGNSDEATLPDDTPFMAQAGGVAGVNVQDPTELQKQKSVFQTRNPYGQQPQMPDPFMPIIEPPKPPKVEAPAITPRTFKDTMGGTEFGQLPVSEQRQYKNTETGETKSFTFVNGKPVYPIPAGFVPIEEAGVEPPDVVKDVLVPTTQVTKEDKDRPSVSQVAGEGSFSLGNLNIGSLAGGALGTMFLGPLGGIIGSRIGGQLGQTTDPQLGGSFSDVATGKFSGSPASGYAGLPKTNKVGTNVGDIDVNTRGTFNNSFAVADNISDLHKYGGAMRDANGHTAKQNN